jgi:hypothetical protein
MLLRFGSEGLSEGIALVKFVQDYYDVLTLRECYRLFVSLVQ